MSILLRRYDQPAGFEGMSLSAGERWGIERLALLGSALEATELGVCLFDAHNRLVFWNRRCEELSGYPLEIFREGTVLDDLILWTARTGFYGPGDPRELATERLAALAAPGAQDVYCFRASGEPVFMRSWRQSDGSLLYIMSAGFDYRAFIENAGDAFLVLDNQGRIAEFNRGAETIFGYSRDEIFGRPFESLFASDDSSPRLAELERRASAEGSRAQPVVLTALRRDGSKFSAEASILRLQTLSGPILGATIRDVSDRVQAEGELRESRTALERASVELTAEHRRVERLARVGHWTWRVASGWSDPFRAGEYEMSEWLRSLFGIPTGTKITDRMLLERVIHPEDRARVEAMWLDHNAGKPGAPIQRWRALRPNGEVRHMEASYENFFDESGALVSSFGTVRDVTETWEMQSELERLHLEQMAEHQRMERLARIGHWRSTLDPENAEPLDAQVMLSASASAILGRPQGEVLTSREFLEQIVHAGDRERIRQHWQTSSFDSRGEVVEFDAQRSDGTKIAVATTYEPIRDERGRIVGDYGTIQDVTERKEAQAALRRHQALLSAMERIAGVGGWEHDPTGRVEIWTDGLYLILGRSRGELAPSAENYLACVHEDDRDRIRAQFEGALQADESPEAEYRIVRPDGSERTVSSRIEVLRDDRGRALRIIGAVVDVSEARHTEAALRQAQRLEAVGHLTGGIAHDFNNLLGVISGNLELLLESKDLEARGRRLAKRAADGARNGAELTKRLLAFSRRQPLWPRNVDLNELLGRMGGMLERALSERTTIELRPGEGLWPCRVDPAKINDTILNLAINAHDAMPDGGRLILETANVRLDESYAVQEGDVTPGEYVALSVSDTGTGMTPEVLARAFEPFYTTKPEGKGTGLGLSMVYGFVKQSKGHINIYSEIGRGTTVRIYLPRATSEAARAAAPADTPRDLPRGTETVLVVEDNERLRQTALEQLSSLGYKTLEAGNPGAALMMLARHPEIALVYSDVVMPGPLTGYDLASEARKQRPDLKILLATGYASPSLADPGLEKEDLEVMSKPVDLASLAAKVRQLLDGPPMPSTH